MTESKTSATLCPIEIATAMISYIPQPCRWMHVPDRPPSMAGVLECGLTIDTGPSGSALSFQ
jgi:hypothetical protein